MTLCDTSLTTLTQQITGIPPEGLTAEEIEKMRKKFGVSFKFSKFVLDDSLAVSACDCVEWCMCDGVH